MVSLSCSLSPLQEWQLIPLLCLLLRLYLSVWRSRPTNYWHNWLGNMVSISCFYSFCSFMGMYWFSLTLSSCVFASGWIAALTGLNTSIPVGIIMLLIAALFTALSVGSLIMFKKVSQSQRSSTCHHKLLLESPEVRQTKFQQVVHGNKVTNRLMLQKYINHCTLFIFWILKSD